MAEFNELSGLFFTSTVTARRRAARQIALIAPAIPVDDFVRFANSASAGERVGAAIGLGLYFAESGSLREDPDLQAAYRALLDDPMSRVRFRAAEGIRACPELVPAFRRELELLVSNDPSEAVRDEAAEAMRLYYKK